jgi:hypothetical protein
MPTPPNLDPISQLYLSDTFYTWYKKTNDLVTKVNPIEVYGITASVVAGSDGIALSDDSLGQWTVGYVLPGTIPNGHTFSGHINLTGVSGPVVNTYNGETGAVVGISTINATPNRLTPDGNGYVDRVPMLINGVTASTGGVMTLDASDIPNTISSITGPAGYIITSSGPTMDWTTRLFLDAAGVSGSTQHGLLIDAANQRVVIGGSTTDSAYKLKVAGGTYGGIKISGVAASANDIQFGEKGAIKADDDLYIMSGDDSNKIQFLAGADGAVHGSCTELMRLESDPQAGTTSAILNITSEPTKAAIRTHTTMNAGFGPHDLSMHSRGSIHADDGLHFSSPASSTSVGSDDSHGNGVSCLFHFGHGNTYGDAETVLAIGGSGQIGLRNSSSQGGIDYGELNQVINSGGDGAKAFWGPGGGGGGNDGTPLIVPTTVFFENGGYDITTGLDHDWSSGNWINNYDNEPGDGDQGLPQSAGYRQYGGNIRNLNGTGNGVPATATHAIISVIVSVGHGNGEHHLRWSNASSHQANDSVVVGTCNDINGGSHHAGFSQVMVRLEGNGSFYLKDTRAATSNHPKWRVKLDGYIHDVTQTGAVNVTTKYWEQVHLDRNYDIFNSMEQVAADADGTNGIIQGGTEVTSSADFDWTTNSGDTGIPADATHVLLTCFIKGKAEGHADDATETLMCNPGSSSSINNRHHVCQVTERAPSNGDNAIGFNHFWMPVDSSGKLYFTLGADIGNTSDTYAKVMISGYAHYVNESATTLPNFQSGVNAVGNLLFAGIGTAGNPNKNLGSSTHCINLQHAHGTSSQWKVYMKTPTDSAFTLHSAGGNYEGNSSEHNTHRPTSTLFVPSGAEFYGTGSNLWLSVQW